ncbi:MAG: hypothetical protein RMI50_02465 [Aquificaceae bacterium]|nr:hypothetical protein [Aquificaceae bacterium]
MRYLVLCLFLLGINFMYSAYSIKVSKDYAKKVSELKREKERSLILKAEIEKHVNYRTAKNYAEASGFGPVNWSRVKIVKFPQ